MSIIRVNNLTFGYEGSYEDIFENVSFQMDTDWKLGFIGRNGRGKTTFMKLLCGQYPYQGSIMASVDFEYFPFDMGDGKKDTLELCEAVYPGLQEWMLMRELSLLDTDADVLYRPYETLSNGERTKVMLALLFSKPNRFLLIDEPTNHLDTQGRESVGRYLNAKKGFILVSHDRAFLDSCIDHVLSINKTDIEIQQGNFSSWWQNKEYRDSFELAENEKLKKEMKHLDAAAKRTAGWSDKIEKSKIGEHSPDRGFIGHKSAKMMARSKATEKRQRAAAQEKSELLKNIETADDLKIHPETHHSDRLVALNDVSIQYGGKTVCAHVSFELLQGQRIALAGKNGSGKSSILKLILGEDIPYTGQLYTASGLKISYVRQDTAGLCGDLRGYARENGLDESLFMAILRKLDFSRTQFEKQMESFSEGQKKKVLIAKSLCESAHVYIWDEPLNYIDVLSRMQIENLILAHRPIMLFVEHDAAFLEKMATSIVHL